jgi:hypothetical protein
LRDDGYQVVDRSRPRSSTNVDTTKTNHGGLAVVGVPGVGLKRLDIGVKPSSVKLLCVRLVSGSSSCVVVLIYRPPIQKKVNDASESAIAQFFVEIADVLDRAATFFDPLYTLSATLIFISSVTMSPRLDNSLNYLVSAALSAAFRCRNTFSVGCWT